MKTLIKLACQASLMAAVSAQQEIETLDPSNDEIFTTLKDDQQFETTTTDEIFEKTDKQLAKELRTTGQEEERLTRLQNVQENKKNLLKTKNNKGQQQKLERLESQVDGGRRLSSVDSASGFDSSASSARRLRGSNKSKDSVDSDDQGEVTIQATADTLLFASAPEFEGTDVTQFYQFWQYLSELFGFGDQEELIVATEEPVTLQDIVDQDPVVEVEDTNVNRRLKQVDSSKKQAAKQTYSKKASPEATNVQANLNSRFYKVQDDQVDIQEEEQEDTVATEEPVTSQDIVDQDPVVEEVDTNVNRRLEQGKRQNDQSLKVQTVKVNGGDSDDDIEDDSDSEDEDATTTTEPAIVVEETIVFIEEPVDTVVVDTTTSNVN